MANVHLYRVLSRINRMEIVNYLIVAKVQAKIKSHVRQDKTLVILILQQ